MKQNPTYDVILGRPHQPSRNIGHAALQVERLRISSPFLRMGTEWPSREVYTCTSANLVL